MGVKKKYSELEKKYKLPSYEVINNEFEIQEIDEDAFILREIRRKIMAKLESYNKIIESLLKPEVSMTDLYECRVFSETEKEEMLKVFKRMMYYDRMGIEISINEDETKTSMFIKEVWKEWPEIKGKLEKYFRELKESWLKETKVKTDVGYLG